MVLNLLFSLAANGKHMRCAGFKAFSYQPKIRFIKENNVKI